VRLGWMKGLEEGWMTMDWSSRPGSKTKEGGRGKAKRKTRREVSRRSLPRPEEQKTCLQCRDGL
jgi:hypothetical protein